MSRDILFAPSEFYHIYNRGTEKRNIFSTGPDYERFLALLYLCNSEKMVQLYSYQRPTLSQLLSLDRGDTLVDICAYCLMPNHFHILIRGKEKGGISRFMQKLTTGYTMYFNQRNDRTGALFQGRFKASHIQDDTYLRYLLSYIHLNPIKIIDSRWKENGIKNRKHAQTFLETYPYSSYRDYAGENRTHRLILSRSVLPRYFLFAGDFKLATQEWLQYQKNELSPSL